jgi:hypothetical protein
VWLITAGVVDTVVKLLPAVITIKVNISKAVTAKDNDPGGKFAISVKDTMELRILSCEHLR